MQREIASDRMARRLIHSFVGGKWMSIPRDRSPSAVVLVEKEGRFFVYEPELGVIASADNVEAAYARFLEARRGFIAEVDEAGLAVPRTAPTAQVEALPVARQGLARELGLFVAKVVIVFIGVGAIALVAVSGIRQSVDHLVASVGPAVGGFGKLSLADVVVKAEDIARDAGNLPDDSKESLRQSVGALSREIEPVVEAWRNPPSAPPAKPR